MLDWGGYLHRRFRHRICSVVEADINLLLHSLLYCLCHGWRFEVHDKIQQTVTGSLRPRRLSGRRSPELDPECYCIRDPEQARSRIRWSLGRSAEMGCQAQDLAGHYDWDDAVRHFLELWFGFLGWLHLHH